MFKSFGSALMMERISDRFRMMGKYCLIHEIPAYMPAVMNYTDYFEVKYIRKGKCVYYTKDSSIELSKGDMIIVPPKVRQCLVVEEEHQAYNIMIRSSTFDTVFLNLVNRDDFLAEFFSEALYGAPTEYVLWHCGENPVIGDLTDPQLRQKMRLKKACELLKNPALSLGKIAGSTGFASESYFCRMFKAEYRMTPTEYREKAVDAGT